MATTPSVDYLSIVDPAHASVVWGYKQAARQGHMLAGLRAQGAFVEQLRRVFRFHLLWRPAIAVRHIDLFNNVALMRFMLSEEAAALCQAGCLHVLTPHTTSLSEQYTAWALGGQESQHWHHLSPDRQHVFDEAFRSGHLSLEKLATLIDLDLLDIELPRLLRLYDRLFEDPALRVLLAFNPTTHPEAYSAEVLRYWSHILNDNQQSAGLRPDHLDGITSLFSQASTEGWRRKQIYTALEHLEHQDPLTPHANPFSLAKIGAVNQAFYDELEHFRPGEHDPSAPVIVSRDITYLSDRAAAGTRERDEPEPELDHHWGEQLRSLDSISLAEIAGWHCGDNPEHKAFTESVVAIQQLMHSPTHLLTPTVVHHAVHQHIRLINKCVERSHQPRPDGTHTQSFVQTLFPHRHNLATGAVSTGIGILSAGVSAAANLHGWQQFCVGAGFAIASGTTSTLLQHRVHARRWRHAELSLKQHITRHLPITP